MTKRKLQLFIITNKLTFIIGFLFLCVIFLASCEIEDYEENTINDSKEKTQANQLPSSVAKDIEIVIYNEKGERTTIISGKTAESMENGDTIISPMRVLFKKPDENNEIKYGELESDYGKFNTESTLEAWGNAILIKENEFRLETEKLYWLNNKNNKGIKNGGGVIKTEKGELVTIYYADGTIVKGKNGVWEQDTNKLTLENTYTESENKSTP